MDADISHGASRCPDAELCSLLLRWHPGLLEPVRGPCLAKLGHFCSPQLHPWRLNKESCSAAGASDILGLECAGIVEDVGEGVTRLQKGDRVCALLDGGGEERQGRADTDVVWQCWSQQRS